MDDFLTPPRPPKRMPSTDQVLSFLGESLKAVVSRSPAAGAYSNDNEGFRADIECRIPDLMDEDEDDSYLLDAASYLQALSDDGSASADIISNDHISSTTRTTLDEPDNEALTILCNLAQVQEGQAREPREPNIAPVNVRVLRPPLPCAIKPV